MVILGIESLDQKWRDTIYNDFDNRESFVQPI